MIGRILFGRFQPLTPEHFRIIEDILDDSLNDDVGDYVGMMMSGSDRTSSTKRTAQTNPLTFSERFDLYSSIPELSNILVNKPMKNIFSVAEYCYQKGINDLHVYAGSDRIDSYNIKFNEYNGVRTKNFYYKFDSIKIIPVGNRDSNIISGTYMRSLVSQDKKDEFISMYNKYYIEHVEQIYNKLKEVM